MAGRSALEVRGLTVSVALPDGRRALVVDDVSFAVEAGGTLGVVGESGSGKTLTALAIMGLLPPGARVESGEVLLDGVDLLRLSQRELQRIRGKKLAMVPQDPMMALDPCFTVRTQLATPLQLHRRLRGAALDAALTTALEQVELAAGPERLRQYPHQLSGGMRQRLISAIALAGNPGVLIADEPTTALDVTTQASYLRLLRTLQEESGFALVLVAHDLELVRHLCDDVVVMYAKQVVEAGSIATVFAGPQHPYTEALLDAVPTGVATRLRSVDGQAPDVAAAPPGCHFAPRCGFAREVCATSVPGLTDRGGRSARCWGTEPEGWILS